MTLKKHVTNKVKSNINKITYPPSNFSTTPSYNFARESIKRKQKKERNRTSPCEKCIFLPP